MGIPLILGRDFREEDNPVNYPDPPTELVPGVEPPEPPGPRYMIINESMARLFFRGRNPIGLHVSLSETYDPARAYEVIGVVKNSRHLNLRDPFVPIVYVPTWRVIWAARSVCIRTAREAPETVEAVRRLIARIDPSIPVTAATTMQQQINENILEDRLIATLSGFFGLLALLLAGVGLYGVVSYSVTRRTREIGIRMALGARQAGVLKLIALDAVLLVIIGIAIGMPAALVATRYIKSLLYGVGAQDPITIAAGTVALAAVAALASFVPARRATKVDPMIALRCE
jgi:predicted permease